MDTSARRDESGAVDTLFYDGQCTLCAGEIGKLRKARGVQLQLVDIHNVGNHTTPNSEQGAPAFAGTQDAVPTKDQLLRVLHLRRADGEWLTGADANVVAWEGTSHQRFLRPLRWPLLRPIVDLVYHYWAKWRYRRLYGAQYSEGSDAP